MPIIPDRILDILCALWEDEIMLKKALTTGLLILVFSFSALTAFAKDGFQSSSDETEQNNQQDINGKGPGGGFTRGEPMNETPLRTTTQTGIRPEPKDGLKMSESASGEGKMPPKTLERSGKLQNTNASREANFQDRLKMQREQATEQFKEKKQEFKDQLQQFKDEKKKEIVERINTKLNERNKTVTDKMAATLERMLEFLKKMDKRVTKAESEGHDMKTVRSLMSAAQTAIEEAQSAVTAQAGKDYTITLTDEDNAKTDVSSTVKQFQSDLQALYKQMMTTRQTVLKAAQGYEAFVKANISVTPEETPASDSSQIQP